MFFEDEQEADDAIKLIMERIEFLEGQLREIEEKKKELLARTEATQTELLAKHESTMADLRAKLEKAKETYESNKKRLEEREKVMLSFCLFIFWN